MATTRNNLLKITLAAAALSVPLLAGCQNKNQHDEWVDQADNRWLTLRSALMLDMAQQQFETGDLDQSEKTLREAIAMHPSNPKLHVLDGRIQLERGRLERAFQMFRMALELDEKNAEAHYYQGLVLQRWQKHQEAYDHYALAYENQADNPAYLVAMSEMLVALDRIDDGIALLEDKLTYFDQSGGLRIAVGHLYRMNNRPDQAAHYFKQASLLEPDNLKIREDLALAQIACGKTDQGIVTLQDLLKQDAMRDRADLKRTLAGAYLDANRTTDARNLYLDLGRGDHADASDWVKLAQLSWRENDLGGTLQAANRVVTMAPNRHEGYLFAGMVWHKRGNLEEALRMFDRAAQRAPKDAEPLILRGLALQRAGRLAAAAEAYEAALKRSPDDARAQRLLQSVAEVTQ